MKKLRIYLDTSVIGGSFDDEFSAHSIRLIENIKNNIISGVISDITIRELDFAPALVKSDFGLYKEKLEVIEITDDMIGLAGKYIEENAVTDKFYEDALHIACATVAQVDLLVSWNFKHIVNVNKITLFNAVNLKNGYKLLQIYSPLEVIDNDE